MIKLNFLIKIGCLFIFLFNLIDSQVTVIRNQSGSNFLCDYYVKHLGKLNKSQDNLKGSKILGRVQFACDNTALIENELFKIFKNIDKNPIYESSKLNYEMEK